MWRPSGDPGAPTEDLVPIVASCQSDDELLDINLVRRSDAEPASPILYLSHCLIL